MMNNQQLYINYSSNGPKIMTTGSVPTDSILHLNDIIMAQYEMKLYERRIFMSIINQFPAQLTNQTCLEFLIDARKIITSNGLKGQSAYLELQKATSNLIKHVCKINEIDGLLQVSLLSSAKYLKGTGQMRLKIDLVLFPYLLKLKTHFSTHNLEKLINFKSYYSQCIYELLKKIPMQNGSFVISIDELKTILKIDNEYERYFDLKRYVIMQAQKELLGHDVAFTFIERKQGKKVIAIQFFVK